jgi:hypothetical protein
VEIGAGKVKKYKGVTKIHKDMIALIAETITQKNIRGENLPPRRLEQRQLPLPNLRPVIFFHPRNSQVNTNPEITPPI